MKPQSAAVSSGLGAVHRDPMDRRACSKGRCTFWTLFRRNRRLQTACSDKSWLGSWLANGHRPREGIMRERGKVWVLCEQLADAAYDKVRCAHEHSVRDGVDGNES